MIAIRQNQHARTVEPILTDEQSLHIANIVAAARRAIAGKSMVLSIPASGATPPAQLAIYE
jgi:hypothetical protein